MSKWVCPACGGGFPELKDGHACPWCELTLEEVAEMRRQGHFDVTEGLRGGRAD
jgi:uncharacterized Zn finger protein (UPF0148 family)